MAGWRNCSQSAMKCRLIEIALQQTHMLVLKGIILLRHPQSQHNFYSLFITKYKICTALVNTAKTRAVSKLLSARRAFSEEMGVGFLLKVSLFHLHYSTRTSPNCHCCWLLCWLLHKSWTTSNRFQVSRSTATTAAGYTLKSNAILTDVTPKVPDISAASVPKATAAAPAPSLDFSNLSGYVKHHNYCIPNLECSGRFGLRSDKCTQRAEAWGDSREHWGDDNLLLQLSCNWTSLMDHSLMW